MHVEMIPGVERRKGVEEPTLLCLVPDELMPKLAETLRRRYAEHGVEVLEERRSRERRSDTERRRKDAGPPKGTPDRRRIRNQLDHGGRRVAERRAELLPVEPPLALPRKARPHADRIAFLQRTPIPAERAEDLETARLVGRIQSGERELFAALYDRYFDRVYGYLRLSVGDAHEAEDLTQQLFTKLLDKIYEYELRTQPFRAWLFVSARNLAISHLRRRRAISVEAIEEINHRREGADHEQAGFERVNLITDQDLVVFLDRLPAAQREALLMRFILDLPNEEIAHLLDRSESDVRMLQSRGLRFLRERLSSIGRAPRRGEHRARLRRARPALTVLRSRRWALIP